MLDKEVKEIWIEALRSGEYYQIKGNLFNGRGYCCLGVLAEVCNLETQRNERLTIESMKEIGLSDLQQEACMKMNDDGDMTFSEIADSIEKFF